MIAQANNGCIMTCMQGGDTPMASVLGSATAVKMGQGCFMVLTVDLAQNIVLTIDQLDQPSLTLLLIIRI